METIVEAYLGLHKETLEEEETTDHQMEAIALLTLVMEGTHTISPASCTVDTPCPLQGAPGYGLLVSRQLLNTTVAKCIFD